MRVTLEVKTGSEAGRTITIGPGPEVSVGRKAPAHVVVSGDTTMSRAHFILDCDETSCRIRDLGSLAGTLLNGAPVERQTLHDGDEVIAGSTTFLVRFDGPVPILTFAPSPTPNVAARFDREPEATRDLPTITEQDELNYAVVKRLRAEPGPLFAILDAARDPLVLVRLHECKEEYQSLYEGPKGERLAAAAPYLVSLPPRSSFLETLIRDGWGKSWGVYLTCDRPFAEVRKHLRRFLTVELEGGKKVLFRFYDPRVMRIFLPTCKPEEIKQFFGPVRAFSMEGDGPETLMRLEADGSNLKRESLPLVKELVRSSVSVATRSSISS